MNLKRQKEIVYNKEYKLLVVKKKLPCTYCPPNKGCNRRYRDDLRSWKQFRKNQWH